MLHLFRNRHELQVLKQLAAALPSSSRAEAGRGSASWADVQSEWTSRELKAAERDNRIAELERELESARQLLAEADASARASETRFDLVNRASSEGLWDMEVVAGDPVNPRNRFWWSQQFREMLGFRDERDFPNVLASWADRLHPDDRAATLDAFARHLNDKSGMTPYRVRNRLAMEDGSYRWFFAQGETLRDSRGVPLRVAGALRDIHDELQREQEPSSEERRGGEGCRSRWSPYP